MTDNVLGYVIRSTSSNNSRVKYISQKESGGYEFLQGFKSAKVFNSFEEANEVLKDRDFTESTILSDGTEFPPYLIRQAGNIDFLQPNGYVYVEIMPVTFGEPEINKTYYGSVK